MAAMKRLGIHKESFEFQRNQAYNWLWEEANVESRSGIFGSGASMGSAVQMKQAREGRLTRLEKMIKRGGSAPGKVSSGTRGKRIGLQGASGRKPGGKSKGGPKESWEDRRYRQLYGDKKRDLRKKTFAERRSEQLYGDKK